MKSPDPLHPWSRLTAAARQLPPGRSDAAPYGFATRVAALAAERRGASLFERIALRAVSVACLLAVLSLATNLSTLAVEAVTVEPPLEDFDPVAILFAE